MQTSFFRYYSLLLLGFVALVLSSCAGLAAANSPQVGTKVTPDTTDPSTLILTLAIDDDENATDGKVGITMVISTDEITQQNYIQLTSREKVLCNGVQLIFNDPVYTARVFAINNSFICEYVRNGETYAIGIPERKHLSPSLEHNSNLQNPQFIIDYTPDANTPDTRSSCKVTAQFSDSSQTISNSVNDLTKHSFTVTINSLSGVGSLIVMRTCIYNFKGTVTQSDTVEKNAAIPFGAVNITYTSTSRLYETWEPPA
jgi:hypothetical protein